MQCAGAISNDPTAGEALKVWKGPQEYQHGHAPNREQNAAAKVTAAVKRKAEEHYEQPSAQLLKSEFQGTACGILGQLPVQPALVRRRARLKNLPPNPTKLSALREIPDAYQSTSPGERFLLYDSGPGDDGKLSRRKK